MTVKERLIEFLKYKKIGQKKFAQIVGVSDGYVNAIRTSIQPNTLHKIAMQYPDLNTGWLITGNGDMLNWLDNLDKPMIKEQVHYGGQVEDQSTYNIIPLYNFDAVGGMQSSNDITDSPAYIERHVPFIDARKDDIAVHVTGNSMIPGYPPGSVVAIRKVQNWREYFGYGHTYVIFLNDGRRILKEVQRFDPNPIEYVLCVSKNPAFPCEELPKSIIVEVWKVTAILTNEGF